MKNAHFDLLVISYLTLFGCECRTDPNHTLILARRDTSDGVFIHSFAVPRSMPELCCLTARVFPEFLGLLPRMFADVSSLTAFLSTA